MWPVPTLCILNEGTVPRFSPSELVLPQWPPQPCRQRAQRRRGPKIANFCRTVQPSIICLLELGHLNDLLFDELVDEVVKEAQIEEALIL